MSAIGELRDEDMIAEVESTSAGFVEKKGDGVRALLQLY